jgi:hypothetical protein
VQFSSISAEKYLETGLFIEGLPQHHSFLFFGGAGVTALNPCIVSAPPKKQKRN